LRSSSGGGAEALPLAKRTPQKRQPRITQGLALACRTQLQLPPLPEHPLSTAGEAVRRQERGRRWRGRSRGGRRSVAPKYRDPKNPENTWTGRGRMPRWMAAALKGGKAKKEDFLIS
jgi:hypothetical protein